MARISKVQKEMLEKFEGITEEVVVDYKATIEELLKRVCALENTIADDKENKTKKQEATINKIETYNGDATPTAHEDSAMRLNYSDKIFSAKNAAKILPPNLIVEGRHSRENISAICGFQVTEEMMDEIYLDFKHDPY